MKWIIETDEQWAGGGAARCPICGYGYSFGAFFEPETFRFCPNCGQRLENPEDDEDESEQIKNEREWGE